MVAFQKPDNPARERPIIVQSPGTASAIIFAGSGTDVGHESSSAPLGLDSDG